MKDNMENKGKEIDYHRYWKDMYEKAQVRIKELEKNRSMNTMDEVAYRELEYKNRELEGGLANALEVNEAHQKQMDKLQTRLTEVEEDNKKLAHQIEDIKLNGVRRAGL